MADFKGIPIAEAPHAPRSGEKYLTPQGFTAIKDGIKPGAASGAPGARKPVWLRAPMPSGAAFGAVKQIVREHRLSTVCEEAKCPNIGECWNAGTATIMLMGAVCTRACRFCAVDTGNPRGWLDPEEPENVARSVELMRLKYVVLTSVDRDDLPDGGAAHYAAAVRAIKARNPDTAVEALTPDFAGVLDHVRTVVDSGLEVFAQNVETVERLTHPVRDPRAGYRQSIDVLAGAKAHRPEILTKTSLMLGLGETEAEIRRTMTDLRAAAVDILTLGQYLRPTANHLDVERFVTPQQFAQYRAWALESGFLECVSGPLVRSSYRAEQALARNNAGLQNGQALAAAEHRR
jgi:lipoic acid synthetase